MMKLCSNFQTFNHHWNIFVNPVGVDATVKQTVTRCVAGGYIWNPFYTQLADPLNVSSDLIVQFECININHNTNHPIIIKYYASEDTAFLMLYQSAGSNPLVHMVPGGVLLVHDVVYVSLTSQIRSLRTRN